MAIGYKIAHVIRDKFPWLWDLTERFNSILFSIRYGETVSRFRFSAIPDGYKIMRMEDVSTEDIVNFFAKQPAEAFTFFKPHGFDYKSIQSLQKNKAFLAFFLIDCTQDDAERPCDDKQPIIAGYFFIRSFFHGKGFRGRMVDIDYRNKGLGTAMNKLLNEIGFSIGLRLYETISMDNIASYRSAIKASNIKIINEDFEKREYFFEILNEPMNHNINSAMDTERRSQFRGGKQVNRIILSHYSSGYKERRAA